MKRTGNPYGAVRLQNLFTQAQPFPVKGVLGIAVHSLIPIPFIYGNHFTALAGHPVITEKIGGIRKDHIHALRFHFRQKHKAVSQI